MLLRCRFANRRPVILVANHSGLPPPYRITFRRLTRPDPFRKRLKLRAAAEVNLNSQWAIGNKINVAQKEYILN